MILHMKTFQKFRGGWNIHAAFAGKSGTHTSGSVVGSPSTPSTISTSTSFHCSPGSPPATNDDDDVKDPNHEDADEDEGTRGRNRTVEISRKVTFSLAAIHRRPLNDRAETGAATEDSGGADGVAVGNGC